MIDRKSDLVFTIGCIIIGILAAILILMDCNGSDPPQPTNHYTRTEIDAKLDTLRAEIPESIVDTVYSFSVDTIFAYHHHFLYDTIIVWNQFVADTLWMKEIGWLHESTQFAISKDPLPPEKPSIDATYIEDVIIDSNGMWIYLLKSDSLKLYWIHSYKDVNGNPLDTADVRFHVAYEMDGETYSLKPFMNMTQELSLIMKALPQGDIVPCVAAYIMKENQKVYSSWAKSTNNGWKARRE